MISRNLMHRLLRTVGKQQQTCYSCQRRWNHQQQPEERKWEEVRIPVPWGHIAGKKWVGAQAPSEQGACPPVIAIHGWRDNAGTFDALAPLLDFDLLSIDLPGHGFSSHAPPGLQPHWPDTIVVLRMVVKHLGLDKVSLLGHSLGSSVSFAYAGLYPDQVHKFVSIECGRARIISRAEELADTWGSTIDSLLQLEQKMQQLQSPEYSYEELVERQQRGAFMSPTLKSTNILLKRGSVQSTSNPDKYVFTFDPRVRLDSFKRPTRETLLALASSIRCQVLSIHAKPGMNVNLEVEFAETIEAMRTNAAKVECHEVQGSHHVHLNNPERVAPLINKFMAS